MKVILEKRIGGYEEGSGCKDERRLDKRLKMNMFC